MTEIKKGDKFTIEGWGQSARGHQVLDGRSMKTGRKMEAVAPVVCKVVKVSKKAAIRPAILANPEQPR